MHAGKRWLLILGVLVAWTICTWIFSTLLGALALMDWSSSDYGLGTFEEILAAWLEDDTYWIQMGIFVPVMIATQVMFLFPLVMIRIKPGQPRSLLGSIILGGLGAAMLTIGLCMGVMSLVQLLGGWLDDWGIGLYTGQRGVAVFEPDLYTEPAFLLPFVCLLVSWLLWSIAIAAFMRRGQPVNRISRLTGLLFAGTIIELILIVPLEAMVRRRTDCMCAMGSFQALLGGFIAALWLLGPMAFVLAIRRRPAWWARHCQRCGYGKVAGAGDQCPECQWPWNSKSTV